jgi:diaminopimelate epimerase
MKQLTATKHHGLGNDFLVVIDSRPDAQVTAELARRLCHRHLGIGADGLILSRPLPVGDDAVATFHLWNADGSEAEMSGNGMRCLAQALVGAGIAPTDVGFGVLTPVGRKQVTVRSLAPGLVWVSVEMGMGKVGGSQQRCNVGHGQLFVDMGNPHLVVLGPDPAGVDVATLGPALEASEPGGLNVEFVALGPGRDEVTMRVWERGVGETQACGTGACATAVALHHWGRVGTRVTVHQPGGDADVALGPDGSVVLSGPSQMIATCTVDPGLLGPRVVDPEPLGRGRSGPRSSGGAS